MRRAVKCPMMRPMMRPMLWAGGSPLKNAMKNSFNCILKGVVSPAQFMLPVLALTVLTLSACGGPESADSTAVKTATAESDLSAASQFSAAQTRSPAPGAPPSVRYLQYPSAGNALPPAATLTNPLDADSVAAQAGEALFAAMNCDGCHGGGALGFVGPSLVDGRWRYGGDDGAVFQSIFYGRPRGMPAYGGLLNDAIVWQLISYLRVQPEPEVVPTVAWVD